jgi:Rad/Gem-related GTP binding protein 1
LNEILPLRNNSNSQASLKKVVILVGNKSDLERSRCVSPLEGRLLATAYDVKFIEVSSSLDVGITELKKGLAAQVN